MTSMVRVVMSMTAEGVEFLIFLWQPIVDSAMAS
jgi:hypothetical protein